MKRIGFKFNEDLLFGFICDSIVGREYGKYVFTMGLNLILEKVAELGNILNLSREEMSYICIQDLLRYSFNSPTSALTSELKHRINYEEKCHSIAKRVKLPSLITAEKEIYCFDLMSSNPNFITNLCVEADIVILNSSSTSQDLSDKIVLIQSADPGYDWIFNRGIKGLITEFGGVASHMAIRSSEFQVAAAIGCGQVIFKNVANARKVILDCESKKIIAL